MKKRALVTGGTGKDIDAMAVLALNMQEKTPNLADEFVVFHDGISEELQKKVNQIMPTRFIRYRCPISKLKLYQNKVMRYFSPMLMCKIDCLKLLNEYEAVVWSDYDVVIKEDLSFLLEAEEAYSFVNNKTDKLKEMFYPSIKRVDMSEYNMEDICITTPLFVLHDKDQNYMKYYEWCYDIARRYIKYMYLPDQCVYTMLTQKFKIPYQSLSNRTYSAHPKEDGDDVKIIHSYGQPKFWSGLENAEWNRYYEQWKNIKES